MPIVAECVFCTARLKVPSHAAGHSVACPRCGNFFTVAAVSETATTAGPGGPTRPALRPLPPDPQAGATAPAAAPRRGGPADPLPEPMPAESRPLDTLIALAFLCGGVGLFFASLPRLDVLTKPLSAVGLLLAVAALLTTESQAGAGKSLRWAALALSLFTLVAVGPWPFVRRAPPDPQPDLSRLTVLTGKDQGMAARESVSVADWFDASRGAAQQHDLRLQVTAVSIEFVPLVTSGRPHRAPRKGLVVRLNMSNTGAFRPITYETWADPARATGNHNPTLTDDTGRTYSRLLFGPAATVKGHVERGLLTPGRLVEEALVFEVPQGRFQYLNLELPASAFGRSGSYRLRIPRDMIRVVR